MKPMLPFPSFDDVIARTEKWLEPFFDDETYQKNIAKLHDFAEFNGKQLYTALKEQVANNDNYSWMRELLRKRYLLSDESLAFSSNMAVKVDWRAPQSGLKRVAHFACAITQIAKASLPLSKYSPNDPLSGWKPLLGACRRPALPKDEFYTYPRDDINNATALILYHGYGFEIQITDNKGAIVNSAQLEKLLVNITENSGKNADVPFTSVSILPTQKGLELRKQLLTRNENHQIMQQIEKALFVLAIDDTHFNNEEEALFDAAFGAGDNFWAYKPLNFICHYKDDRIFVNFERSHADPSTIADLLMTAKPYFYEKPLPRKNNLPENLHLQQLNWKIDGKKEVHSANIPGQCGVEGTLKILKEGLADYHRNAENWVITTHDLFITVEDSHLLREYSRRGICQLLLQYAELVALGSVSSISDLIDLRQFANGRSDILITTTQESKNFVSKLAVRTANLADLNKALEVYEERAKATCSGQGTVLFLLALKYAAHIQGIDSPVFNSTLLSPLLTPRINSVTIRDEGLMSGLSVIPLREDGIGVNYQISRNHFTFVLTHHRHYSGKSNIFNRAISSGIKQILQLMRSS